MGTALNFLRELLEKIGLELDRKTATSLLILFILLILLPIGIFLSRRNVNFFPRAAGELIQLNEGGCIKLDKNKKKVVDCAIVPLKLVNPFYNIKASPGASSNPSSLPSSTANPSIGSSSEPSPTASNPGGPQSIRVNGNSSVEIKAALDQVKGTGGSVYLPSGTYIIHSKVTIPANTTLFGDGIDATILEAGIEIDEEESVVGNDTNGGQENVAIRDMTIRGHAEGSESGIKLRNLNGGYVYNVKVERAISGILLGFHNGRGVNNVHISSCQVLNTRTHGIFMTLGENNVISNCSINGGGSDSLGIGLEIGVEGKISGNKVISNSVTGGGHSLSFTAGNDFQYDSSWVNSGNIVCYNNASNNKIQPIWDQRGSGNVYVGNNVNVNNVNSFGYEEKGGTDPICDIPAQYMIPNAPAKPSAGIFNLIDKLSGNLIAPAFAQDSDDNFTGTSGDDSDDQFVTGSSSPAPQGSAGNSNVVRYRLAESQAGLANASWKDFVFIGKEQDLASENIISKFFSFLFSPVFAQDSDDNFTGTSGDDSDDQFLSSTAPGSSGNPSFSIGKQFIITNYQLNDIQPGPKQIWVQFLHPDGTSRVDHVTFDLVEKVPQITGLACNLDISKQNLKITIDGNYFGTDIGKITSVTGTGSSLEILGWNPKQVQGQLKNTGSITEGARYQLKVVRADGFESQTAVCAVDKSLISLGARLFCREPGKFDATDVVVTLLSSEESGKASRVEEKVSITAQGEIANLRTQLQAGKNYALSIKAPGSLRRTAVFTASEGTSQITRPDGSPFILPVGDIAPVILPDGQINTLDRAELIRQWRILPASGSASVNNAKQTGDFNRDGKVNSVDWACMLYDFGSSDDPIPAEVPGAASGTITIPSGASGTITIPVSSPSPSPKSSTSSIISDMIKRSA